MVGLKEEEGVVVWKNMEEERRVWGWGLEREGRRGAEGCFLVDEQREFGSLRGRGTLVAGSICCSKRVYSEEERESACLTRKRNGFDFSNKDASRNKIDLAFPPPSLSLPP